MPTPSLERRTIIEDFEKSITEYRTPTGLPVSIRFRNEKEKSKQRTVWEIPLHLLRFRKDNGRISAEVESYESKNGAINEASDEGQLIISQFLEEKNPGKTIELKNLLRKDGQLEPAIATRDGFLINGNRRRLALAQLAGQLPGDDRFKYMHVVLLPGSFPEEPDGGPPPTLNEIEQIENRYQYQNEGKEEYTDFDKALSIRRKMKMNMDLEEQLRDDANYQYLDDRQFKKQVKEFRDKFIGPLDCIDRYLENIGKPGEYEQISSGPNDREGRWQAFLDYYSFYSKLTNEKDRIDMQLEEEDVGKIECIVFSMIRRRHFPDIIKLHALIRKLPKLLKNPRSREEILKIAEIKEAPTKSAQETPNVEKDEQWISNTGSLIVNYVKKAIQYLDFHDEQQTSMQLLEHALDSLTDENLETSNVPIDAIPTCMAIIEKLQARVEALFSEFDHFRMLAKKKEYTHLHDVGKAKH